MNELLRRLLFLPPQASTMAEEIDDLHYFVIITTMIGATLVTLVGGYFLIRYRRRDLDVRRSHPGARSRQPLALEAAALVGLAALFLIWWFIGMRQFVALRVGPLDAMVVYVTAKQWMWKFAYPQGARAIASLYVPAGRPVRLVMTSRDVIHSFFVPQFRIKQDVLPGRYTTVWFEAKAPGRYPILCTEYCGTGHSTMRGEVIALDPVDFERWLAGAPEPDRVAGPEYVAPAVPGEASPHPLLSLTSVGEEISGTAGCLRCHTVDGTPHIGPTWAGLYGSTIPLEGGGAVIADEAYITESIMDPLARLHAGYAPVMPSYLGRLGAPETAAIVEYIRSLREVRPEPAEGPSFLLAPERGGKPSR